MILINHASAHIRKERLSPTSKARREASRNEYIEKGGVSDRVKSYREINSGEDRLGARPGSIKPIQNGLRKEQNFRADRLGRKPAWRERKNGIRFQKK